MQSDSPARLLHFLVGFGLGVVPGGWIGRKVGEALVEPTPLDALAVSDELAMASRLGMGIGGCLVGVLCFLWLDPLLAWVVDRLPSQDDGAV